MSENNFYTTQLGAGLGLIDETRTLLELWELNMTSSQLQQEALKSGRFPNVAARRLRNIIAECFAPRYLVNNGGPARRLKQLLPYLSRAEFQQILLLYTCRANPIFGDFIRQVYWVRYAGAYTEISNEHARNFVERAIDQGRMTKNWSENMISRVSGYLTGCCADYGMLEHGRKSVRAIIPFHIAPKVSAYIAHELHFAGLGDNAMLSHADWGLYGLDRFDVLDELKQLSLKGLFIVQAAGEIVTISWKHQSMESFCNATPQI